jgi:hypothetical protein
LWFLRNRNGWRQATGRNLIRDRGLRDGDARSRTSARLLLPKGSLQAASDCLINRSVSRLPFKPLSALIGFIKSARDWIGCDE